MRALRYGLVALVLVCATVALTAPATNARQTRPNVIVIMTDDMAAADISSMPYVHHTLTQMGTTFDRAYSNYPLCCPASASFFTGLLAHNHGVMGNHTNLQENPEAQGGYAAWAKMGWEHKGYLPTWLHAAGYSTIQIGKYFAGYEPHAQHDPAPPPGWDHWYVPYSGTYDYTHYRLDVNGSKDTGFRRRYQTVEWTRLALQQLTWAERQGRPFFMDLHYIAPHAGREDGVGTRGPPWCRHVYASPYPRFADMVDGFHFRASRSVNEAYVQDKPWYIRQRHIHRTCRYAIQWRRRQASLVTVDNGIRQIMKRLRRDGILDNTLVIFVSDNGYLTGQHRYWGKNVPYQESIRVPLVVVGPGFPVGVVRHQPAEVADLATTIVDETGADPTYDLDGKDLQTLADFPHYLAHRLILLEAGPDGMMPSFTPLDDKHRFYAGIVTARGQVYIEYQTGEREYYDLETDPNELHNLYGTVNTTRLAAQLDAIKDCSGASCP